MMMAHVPYPITLLVVLLILLASCAEGSLHSPFPLLQRYSELFHSQKKQDSACSAQNANLVIQDVRLKGKAVTNSINHAVHNLQDKFASSSRFVMKNTQLLQRWQAVLATTADISDTGLATNEDLHLAPNNRKLYINKGKLSNWWKRQSEGRSGLLVKLAPTLASQFQLVRTAVPFCVDRMVQYIQPLNLVMLATLSKPRGIRALQYGLLASIGLGGLKMLQDSFAAGSNWLPAYAQEDSYAVVTGASSGLGKELAKELFAHGYNLVLVASDKAKLESIKASLSDSVPVISAVHEPTHPSSPEHHESPPPTLTRRAQDIQLIPCDLANPMTSFNILQELKKMNIENKIDVLVCNAGKGQYGAVHESSPSALRTVIDVNVMSTVNLIRVLLPRMLHRKLHNHNAGSRILIVSSTAAAGPAEKVATYSASKAFLSSFAQSLRRELLPHGLMVTLAQPGPLKGTNFVHSANGLNFTPLMYKLPGMVLKADVAAHKIFQSMRVGHDVITPGVANKFFVHFLAHVLPPPVVSSIVKLAWGPFPPFKSKSKQMIKGGIRMNYKPSNFRQKMVDFWFQPVVDYEGIKRWWKRSIRGGNHQSRQPDVAPFPTVVEDVDVPVQKRDEVAELEATEKQEEYQASEYFQTFRQSKPEHSKQQYEAETYVEAYRTEATPTTKDSSDSREGEVELHYKEDVHIMPKHQGDGDAELILEDNIEESDCFLFRSATTTHWV